MTQWSQSTKNLNFSILAFCLLFLLLNTIEYIYILSKKLLKRNTNNYNDVIMYLGHIWPNDPTAEKAINFDILAVSLLLVLLNAMTYVYILSKQVLKPKYKQL